MTIIVGSMEEAVGCQIFTFACGGRVMYMCTEWPVNGPETQQKKSNIITTSTKAF